MLKSVRIRVLKRRRPKCSTAASGREATFPATRIAGYYRERWREKGEHDPRHPVLRADPMERITGVRPEVCQPVTDGNMHDMTRRLIDAAAASSSAAVHQIIYLGAYYEAVNESLKASMSREQALAALESIREFLLSGGL